MTGPVADEPTEDPGWDAYNRGWADGRASLAHLADPAPVADPPDDEPMEGAVLIPKDPEARAKLAQFAGLSDDERDAIDQWAFDEETRQRSAPVADGPTVAEQIEAKLDECDRRIQGQDAGGTANIGDPLVSLLEAVTLLAADRTRETP